MIKYVFLRGTFCLRKLYRGINEQQSVAAS